jgi:ubiquinone biosynthesis UbiH/UbiF/VisC/COQ6 family hydroxylase
MVDNFDIVIVGGGLNGAALALALKDTAYRVALVEAAPPGPLSDAWDPRVYAYSPGNVDWLSQLGGWGEPVRAEPVRAMRIHGDSGARMHFDAIEAGLAELAWIAENGRLQYTLWQAIGRATNIECVSGRPEAIAWGDGYHVLALGDGRKLRARLLVGADGANSWVRRQAGIEIDSEDYRHTGVVANFETEKPHRGIAWQWFGDGAVLAYLPLPGRRISIVWSTPTDLAPARLALAPDEFAAQVAEAGRHSLGALHCVTPQVGFPLIRRRARAWVRPGLVLLGDAAHTVHPLAGQGVNLGFRDSRLLATLLASGGNPGEIGRLQAYAVRRMEDVASMQTTTGGLKKLFSNPNPALRWLRNAGLVLTDETGWLKQALMRHAIQ